MKLVKAHAFGNDFLLLDAREAPAGADRAVLSRRVCERHRGIGADGLIVFEEQRSGASMRLLNADGSPAEVSGNGVRCLAAWLVMRRGQAPGSSIEIATDAGLKRLEFLSRERDALAFCAAMGQPERIERHALHVCGVGDVAFHQGPVR